MGEATIADDSLSDVGSLPPVMSVRCKAFVAGTQNSGRKVSAAAGPAQTPCDRAQLRAACLSHQ